LPLIHSAYITAILFSVANALLMVKRIHTEEQALSEDSNYAYVFADQPRFIPRKQGVKIAIQMKRFTIAKAIAALIVPAPIAMCQMISGFWVSRAIYIVAKLGIADYLHKQPKTADELAAITNTHAPSLYRVLRALASVGVFVEDDNHR